MVRLLPTAHHMLSRAHKALQPALRSTNFSTKAISVESPFTGKTVASVPFVTGAALEDALLATSEAQKEWSKVPIANRKEMTLKFVKAMEDNIESIATDITSQMGKPLGQARNEVKGLATRARAFIDQAEAALADQVIAEPTGSNFRRRLVHDPVGVVAVIAPWNYPLLTAGNSVIPAVLAGNGVFLKHSPQTPLCGLHFQRAFEAAGFPKHLVTAAMVSHDDFASAVVPHNSVGYVAFTGSVAGGRNVYKTVAGRRFIDVGLELGGKDAMYVAEDADVASAAANAVDGACYNAGQSCCAVERVFVHRSLYKDFVEKAADLMKKDYTLGDPSDPKVNMGPLSLDSAVPRLRYHVHDAVRLGAKIVAGGADAVMVNGKAHDRFFKPTLVADCTQDMLVMKQENFGPLLAVQRVDSDDEAVRLINNTTFGLTTALWTQSEARAEKMMPKINSGTVFMNRCDYLDPYLVWTGRGTDSGKGASMGHPGFHAVTKLKSVHYKLKP